MPTKKSNTAPPSEPPTEPKSQAERKLDFSVALLGQLVDQKVQDVNKYWQLAEDIVERLVMIMASASEGNSRSRMWLKAIEKIFHPQKFELPLNKIEEIAIRYETNPQLARGWALTALMSHLTHVVEPRDKKHSSPSDPVVMRSKSNLPGSEYVVKEIDRITLSYLKRNSTLQSLAIRMYLDSLQREGVIDDQATINERTLKRDLQVVKKWEQTATDDERYARGICVGYSLGGGVLLWCQYSEGWKDRKKKITARKRVTKKRTS